LGDRPRRKQQASGSATVFSFGSIVGQSSVLTPTSVSAATVVSEGNNSPAATTAQQFEQLKKANKRLNQNVITEARRHKSGIQQDLELVWKQLRRWTGTEESIDLQRNRKGCLT
jgi:hypothetical protein